MADLNRRQFVLAATTAGTAAVCGCLAGCAASGDAGAVWRGPTSFDLGPASGVAKDGLVARWSQSGGFFIVRDAGKIYVMSTVCTHKACDLAADGGELFCDCHNSHFGLD